MAKWIPASQSIEFPKLGLELNPPLGFEIGSFEFRFYGLIIAIGMILAVIYGLKRSRQFGLKQDDILDGFLWIMPVAVICARLYYCIFEWSQYKSNPISILYIWEGGLAIYGGVIGAALCVILFSKLKKVNLFAVLDLVALSFLIGQSIGRWGNFINREAHGCETNFFLGMTFDGYMGPYHPTFLYESLWNAAGFALLHFLSKKRKYDGQIALGYVAWYGLGRTFIEGLRTDSLYFMREVLGEKIRFSQVLAAVSCIIAVVILVLKYFNPPKKALFVVQQERAQKLADEEMEYEYVAETEETEETEEVEETEETAEEE